MEAFSSLIGTLGQVAPGGEALSGQGAAAAVAWWVWPLALFATTFLIGILGPLGGVGGGVLFTPIVGGFFPFNLDFVRATGLLVALSGSLAAAPGLLRRNLASLRLAIPPALIASTSSIVGAQIGLALPVRVVQLLLGATILGIAVILLLSRSAEFPRVTRADPLAAALGIGGSYHDAATGQTYEWKVWRTPIGLALFVAIGVMAGMFGLGAGWANVPVLNLVMGAPLKIAVATSNFLLSITDTSAAWIYLNAGAIIPAIAVPSLLGIMLGARLGVRLLAVARPRVVRYVVIALLFAAGVRPLMQALGI